MAGKKGGRAVEKVTSKGNSDKGGVMTGWSSQGWDAAETRTWMMRAGRVTGWAQGGTFVSGFW